MKKAFLLTAIAFFLSFSSVTVRAEALAIDAKAYILIDAKTGQVLYEQNSDEKLYPASTTKIMTAILAIEKGDMNQMMTASRLAVSQYSKDIDKATGGHLGIGVNGSNVGLEDGEQVRLEDLLNVLLIKSANDAANIIAENLAPTRADFIEMMNKRAVELGATNTNFTNTCGLDVQDGHPNHVTSARDMAKFAQYAMTLPIFREIVKKTKYTMPDTNKHPASFWPAGYLSSTNKLMMENQYKSSLYQTIGIKTGFTVKAGYNLVAAGRNEEGMELISVMMGVNNGAPNSIFTQSKKLLEYGFTNFSLQKVSEANEKIDTVTVQDAEGDGKLDLVTEGELKCVLPSDKTQAKLEKKQVINSNIAAPVKQGDVLGHIEYTNNGVPVGQVNVVAASAIEKKVVAQTSQIAKDVLKNGLFRKLLYGCLIFLAALTLLRITLRRISRSVRARKQEN